MTRLIDDLLDVSRITEGRIQLQRQILDIGAVIADAVESVEPLMRSENNLMIGQFRVLPPDSRRW